MVLGALGDEECCGGGGLEGLVDGVASFDLDHGGGSLGWLGAWGINGCLIRWRGGVILFFLAGKWVFGGFFGVCLGRVCY